RERRWGMRSALWRIGFLAVLLAAWAGVSSLRIWPSYLFPSPGEVAASVATMAGSGVLFVALATTTGRLLVGYGFSLVFGTALGFGTASSVAIDRTLGTLVTGLQSLPSICWLPVAILWFGLSEAAIQFVVVM